MSKGGTLIRLIDVAMIILFGFIAISDIKVRAQIKLPSEKQESLDNEEEKQPELVFVRIDADHVFVVEHNHEQLLTTNVTGELEAFLKQLMVTYRADKRDMVVLVEPHEDSVIQRTIDVLDMCERNRIPKNINYESMQF